MGRVLTGLQRGENSLQGVFVLQLAQVGGVRGTDVDDKEIGQGAQLAEGMGIILGGHFEGGVFRLAQIDAHGMARPAVGMFPRLEFAGKDFGAGIVEAHAVNDGFIGDGAEHAGRGIAGLGAPSDAAEFGEAEPQFFPDGHGGGEFIHAGGEADGVGKIEAKDADGQGRRTEERFEGEANHGHAGGEAEVGQGEVVGALGVLPEERGAEEMAVSPAHNLALE